MIHGCGAALVHGDQRVGVRGCRMNPVQLAGDPERRFVEVRHWRVGDRAAHELQKPCQAVGFATARGHHGALGGRGAEQLGQCLRGALLGQELSDVEVEVIAVTLGPYCTSATSPSGAGPQVETPQPQWRVMSWCSVTRTVIGGRSNT